MKKRRRATLSIVSRVGIDQPLRRWGGGRRWRESLSFRIRGLKISFLSSSETATSTASVVAAPLPLSLTFAFDAASPLCLRYQLDDMGPVSDELSSILPPADAVVAVVVAAILLDDLNDDQSNDDDDDDDAVDSVASSDRP